MTELEIREKPMLTTEQVAQFERDGCGLADRDLLLQNLKHFARKLSHCARLYGLE